MPQADNAAFQQAFGRLNDNQRAAVEQTDGPLLVIAGPGTGKTQLLSARVAYILQNTDTLPQNILCLTFTESGAQNMRDRLTRFIGQAAYDVAISTYHAFGGDLIGRFPQYFGDHRAQSPVDGLGQRQIVQAIVDAMEFRNPLKSTQHHLHDLISTISEVKRGLLDEADLRAIADDNLAFLADANSQTKEIFADFTSMPRKLDKALPFFENLYNYLDQRGQAEYQIAGLRPLAGVVKHGLELAIYSATEDNTTKPLTAWKNQWLVKDAGNNFIFGGQRESQRVEALAGVFHAYTQALEERGLYDFDDMILRSIKALERHDDFRYSLQEQYQYILLDEFQDTNKAQLRLVELLTDNPVHEGRPNVMAVGDDDQAIYAFQGAEVSNMLQYRDMYRGTTVINLTQNYRSHPEVLYVARQVADQIKDRLAQAESKILTAANKDIPPQAHIDRHEFQADVGQYDWIAHRIETLIKDGTPAQEIAVLAPRHKQLEPLVPFLNELNIPVRYEKRENILEAPVVKQLLTMAKLVLAIANGQDGLADALWPEVLSYNFWGLPTSAIWQLSWQVRGDSGLGWSRAILEDRQFRTPGLLILSLAKLAASETLENMMDGLVGNALVPTGEQVDGHDEQLLSPLRAFYLGADAQTDGPELFYQTLSHLTCLRERLRDHQNAQEEPLKLADLLALVRLYEEAGERMLNTSPYNQHAEAVQLMTVFKAKGLEFEHVFLPSVQDDVWGEASRGQANRLTLPPNMLPIRPAGTTEDERLRIFFVAITRAKLGLHLTSYLQTYSGRATKRLKYLNEQEMPGSGGFKTMILPAECQDVKRIEREVPQLSTLELNWRQRHFASLADSKLRDLLATKLENFKLSPTQLGTFTDMIYGGPQAFFFDCLLCFPREPGADADFGTAIHETLQWVQQQVDGRAYGGDVPPKKATLDYFEARLKRRRMRSDLFGQFLARGHYALDQFMAARHQLFRSGNRAEYNFRNENVLVGDVRMGGKADLMEIDQQSRTICIVDYKTGKAYDRWSSDAKLYKYKRQLLCYKLLVENSRSWRGYRVESGRLEFVEPDDNGRIHQLELKFSDQDIAETKALLAAVWRCVQNLEFPDISQYERTLAGTRQFEAALLAAGD